jgi:DNA polymerase-3 subunit alpha
MDSISCYFHEHELEEVDEQDYGFIDFYDLPENPEIERVVPIKGKQIPMFKIRRIMGTVLDKDKAKKTITLLTKGGVVTVKIFAAEVFSHYDKQISQKNETTGKKKVIEKSWFSRGNKIIVTGIRREDSFIAKKYKNTPFHFIELITEVKNGEIKTRGERVEV